MEYCPTDEMTADIGTKPLQGSKFRKFRNRLLNITTAHYATPLTSDPQECVETLDDNQELDDEETADPQDPDSSAQCYTSETIQIGSNNDEWILVTCGKHGEDLNESRI